MRAASGICTGHSDIDRLPYHYKSPLDGIRMRGDVRKLFKNNAAHAATAELAKLATTPTRSITRIQQKVKVNMVLTNFFVNWRTVPPETGMEIRFPLRARTAPFRRLRLLSLPSKTSANFR